jgi:hypothetical protein
MKKFFLHDGKEQQGPFDIEELKIKSINKDTSIWHEGLLDWTAAKEIEELSELFNPITPPRYKKSNTPPPINKNIVLLEAKQNESNTVEPKKKSIAGKTITVVVVVVILIFSGLIIFDNINNSSTYETGGDTYQEKIMTIEEIERATPTDFLSASGTYNENFWGDKFKLSVRITNTATVASYKDAVIRITYYSKTETVLGIKDYTVYETFLPTSNKTVELEIDNYKDVNSLDVKIIKATSK